MPRHSSRYTSKNHRAARRHRPCVPAVYAWQRYTQVKVLLADDDADRAGAVARILAADPGLAVLRLGSGQSLVEAVADNAPDVVLVDMARPDRDALDGIRLMA